MSVGASPLMSELPLSHFSPVFCFIEEFLFVLISKIAWSCWENIPSPHITVSADCSYPFLLIWKDFLGRFSVLKNHCSVLQASSPTIGTKCCCRVSEYPEMEQFQNFNFSSILLFEILFYRVIWIKPLQFWCNFCVMRCTCILLVRSQNSFFIGALHHDMELICWCLGQDVAVQSAHKWVLHFFVTFHEQTATVCAVPY